MSEERIEFIDPDRLLPDSNQPRQTWTDEDLEEIKNIAKTYEEHGVIDPVEVDENNIIILGERRWRAGLYIKHEKGVRNFKLRVRRKTNLAPNIRFERQLIDDSQRKELSPMDKAWAYATAIVNINDPSQVRTIHDVKNMEKTYLNNYLDKSVSPGQGVRLGQSELARRIGVTQNYIKDYLKLLQLEPETQQMIDRGELPITAGRELVKVDEQIRPLLEQAIREKPEIRRNGIATIAQHVTEPEFQTLPREEQESRIREEVETIARPSIPILTEEEAHRIQEMQREWERHLNEILQRPIVRRRRVLIRNWLWHTQVATVLPEIKCPICGADSSHLQWSCHHLPAREAVERAREKLEESQREED